MSGTAKLFGWIRRPAILKRAKQSALACALLIAGCCLGVSCAIPPNGDGDCVVLLHGLGRGTWSMKRMEWDLRREGYHVVNVGYPSTRASVDVVATNILPEVLSRKTPGHDKVHFVTHSLGGIILRRYLKENMIPNLGRVVMLGPPNQGSEVAEKLRANHLFRRFLGPAGQCLGTGTESLPTHLGPANFDVGVIAGDRSLNPLFSAWLKGADDGKVSVESTRLKGMKAHLIVHRSHTWMTWRKDVINATSHFLRCGNFEQR